MLASCPCYVGGGRPCVEMQKIREGLIKLSRTAPEDSRGKLICVAILLCNHFIHSGIVHRETTTSLCIIAEDDSYFASRFFFMAWDSVPSPWQAISAQSSMTVFCKCDGWRWRGRANILVRVFLGVLYRCVSGLDQRIARKMTRRITFVHAANDLRRVNMGGTDGNNADNSHFRCYGGLF